MTTSNILSQLGSPGVSTGFKNRIINGAMVIDQRNAGASVTPTDGQFIVDRWRYAAFQASKVTAQQNQGAVSLPAGFTKYLGITSSSAYSVPSGEYYYVGQPIEGFNVADLNWGTANAKTVTLSFQVYSSLTGTFGGSLLNSAQNRSYPFSYSIPVANAWTSISVTIPGDTTGTWLTTNGIGILVAFNLGSGSTFSGTANAWAGASYFAPTGATSIVGTNNATFYITGVQLEVGTTATNFEVRSYGTELALCQRYFYKLNRIIQMQSTANGAGNTSYMNIPFFVSMRANPTISTNFAGGINLTTQGISISSSDGMTIYMSSAAAGGYYVEYSANNTYSAEL